jgi:hypothetical protein
VTYHVIRFSDRPEYAFIEDEPENLDDCFEVNAGSSLKSYVHGTIRMRFYKKHQGMKLDDFVDNLFRWILCSERARAVFAAECDNVEVYPLEILNHKKKPVGVPYFFVQPVGVVDCVDLEKSEFQRDCTWQDKFLSVYRLVLREKAIPRGLKLFRMKEMPAAIVIRSDLVEKLREAGATGFELRDTGVPILL